MAVNAPHPKTLFHLVPINQVAHDALRHPDNKRFVSHSSKGRLGLEVGYHVSLVPRGHVITRLGRDADLILCETSDEYPMSAVHVAFEINPATRLVVLSVRSKRLSTVRLAISKLTDKQKPDEAGRGEDNPRQEAPQDDEAGEAIEGDGVILYLQNYVVCIASYKFELLWPDNNTLDAVKAFVFQGYQTALAQLRAVRSRHQPTLRGNSEVVSWHNTRLNTTKRACVDDIRALREFKGAGSFGTVFQTVDRRSGDAIAVKVVNLGDYGDIETARALLHREIKVMERLQHRHIIEYLGHQHFDTLHPEIFMPLRKGTLTSLVKTEPIPDYAKFCREVLRQMLSALDYLASKKLVHRDVKPDNILYSILPGDRGYQFQLADFGLAHHHSLATTVCGTGYYQAPELWPDKSKVYAPQSHKMDVWSLYATMVAIDSGFKYLPRTADYSVVLKALEEKAQGSPLEPMARRHPDRRASAAQMLLYTFSGEGLETPRSEIPPIPPAVEVVHAGPSRAAGPSNPPRTNPQTDPQTKKVSPRQPAVPPRPRPLVVYPPPLPSAAPRLPSAAPQLSRAHRDGVTKRRARPPTARADALSKLLTEQAVAEEPPDDVLPIPGAFVD